MACSQIKSAQAGAKANLRISNSIDSDSQKKRKQGGTKELVGKDRRRLAGLIFCLSGGRTTRPGFFVNSKPSSSKQACMHAAAAA